MKSVSNFTEESTAEEIVNLLDEFIPCLDEDRQFIRKYRTDFIYHYKNGFGFGRGVDCGHGDLNGEGDEEICRADLRQSY